MTGIVKRVIPEKGFGFIVGDDKVERFFHASGLVPPLTIDQLAAGETRVEFQAIKSPKGPRAEDICLA